MGGLCFSRVPKFELEADRLAVKMMAGAGYDPGALLRYIDRVQPAGAASYVQANSYEVPLRKSEHAVAQNAEVDQCAQSAGQRDRRGTAPPPPGVIHASHTTVNAGPSVNVLVRSGRGPKAA